MKPALKRALLLAGLLMVLGGLWMSLVDASWFVEECPECHWGADVIEYRVCGRAISQTEEVYEESWHYLVTVDLGVPCQHPGKIRWHKHRYWGLCYCAAPCINGSYRLVDDESYSDLSPRVRAWRELDPTLGPRFRDALAHDDREFVKEFFRRLRAGESPPPGPIRAVRP